MPTASAPATQQDTEYQTLLSGVEAERKTNLWAWALGCVAILIVLELTLANRTFR